MTLGVRIALGSLAIGALSALQITLFAARDALAQAPAEKTAEREELRQPDDRGVESVGRPPVRRGVPALAPPSLVLEDGGLEFPDGTVQETSATEPPPQTALVVVDCGSGDTVADALREPAHELTIEIVGLCDEDVVIRRDNVTLRGTDPFTDGLRGASSVEPFDPVVRILHSSNVSFENLGVYDGLGSGLRTEGVTRLFIENGRITGHAAIGLGVIGGGGVRVNGTEISADIWGVSSSGEIGCDTCTIHGGQVGWVAFAAQQVLRNSTVTSDYLGVWAQLAASLSVIDGSSVSSAGPPATAFGNARISLGAATLSGSSIECYEQSALVLSASQQTSNTAGFNILRGDCWTHLEEGSALLGLQEVGLMSKMTIVDTSTVDDLNCVQGSDAWCEDPTVNVIGSSNCGQCQ